jgi:hypothetical protein
MKLRLAKTYVNSLKEQRMRLASDRSAWRAADNEIEKIQRDPDAKPGSDVAGNANLFPLRKKYDAAGDEVDRRADIARGKALARLVTQLQRQYEAYKSASLHEDAALVAKEIKIVDPAAPLERPKPVARPVQKLSGKPPLLKLTQSWKLTEEEIDELRSSDIDREGGFEYALSVDWVQVFHDHKSKIRVQMMPVLKKIQDRHASGYRYTTTNRKVMFYVMDAAGKVVHKEKTDVTSLNRQRIDLPEAGEYSFVVYCDLNKRQKIGVIKKGVFKAID